MEVGDLIHKLPILTENAMYHKNGRAREIVELAEIATKESIRGTVKIGRFVPVVGLIEPGFKITVGPIHPSQESELGKIVEDESGLSSDYQLIYATEVLRHPEGLDPFSKQCLRRVSLNFLVSYRTAEKY